jgi:hypothetical protein
LEKSRQPVETNSPQARITAREKHSTFHPHAQQALSAAAMYIGNEDRSPVRVYCCNAASTPASFAEIVGYDFQTVRWFHRL